jgi:hypothetical protein
VQQQRQPQAFGRRRRSGTTCGEPQCTVVLARQDRDEIARHLSQQLYGVAIVAALPRLGRSTAPLLP